MNQKDNICKYLDIPLQHISTQVLKSMRRGINKQKTTDLIQEIRQKVPDIAIRTTFICGYPGETQQDFDELKEWIEEMRFDRLGVFTYSHEENTHAFSLKDDVPEKIKKARAQEIMDTQSTISLQLNEKKVGKTFKTLFDRVEGDYFVGRTEYDSPEVDNEVWVHKKDNYVRLGDFANVKIKEATEFDLYGNVV